MVNYSLQVKKMRKRINEPTELRLVDIKLLVEFYLLCTRKEHFS